MKKITVILTCFNRREKTLICLKSLVEKNPSLQFQFILVDDKSTDGTVDVINELHYDVEILTGTGNLFWCGGMRVGIQTYLDRNEETDCLIVNDDVDFFDSAIERMVAQAESDKSTVIVGATQSKTGKFTYGLRKHRDKHGIYLNPVKPNNQEITGETMNANCVLIPSRIMKKIGNMDVAYSHSLGDYDLGFRIYRMRIRMISSDRYIGICEENSFENTWRDPKVKRMERLKKKETPKGTPFREWFYYLNKNYGFGYAILYSTIPYVKIILGK